MVSVLEGNRPTIPGYFEFPSSITIAEMKQANLGLGGVRFRLVVPVVSCQLG